MSSRAPQALRAYAAVAVTILSWAAAFPAIRLALRELQPVPLAAARFAVAALLVLAWLAWRRPPRPALPDLLRFALCGLIGIAAYNILLNTGQRTVAAGAASFIVNTAPILTALLARLVLGERFGARGWAGTLVSFAGIALIASAQPGGLAFGAGASLVLGSALCMACYVVLQKPLVARHGALACTAWTLLAGALWLSPWLPEAAGELPGAGGVTIGDGDRARRAAGRHRLRHLDLLRWAISARPGRPTSSTSCRRSRPRSPCRCWARRRGRRPCWAAPSPSPA